MKNEIIKVSESQFDDIRTTINTEDTFLVEIDGKEIQSKTQLLDVMEQKYDLHTSDGTWGRNWDALDDLMEDLGWIPQKNHILAIHSYSKLFTHDKKSKVILNECMKDWLEFWEEEVLYCVVDGKTKEFTVYLVD